MAKKSAKAFQAQVMGASILNGEVRIIYCDPQDAVVKEAVLQNSNVLSLEKDDIVLVRREGTHLTIIDLFKAPGPFAATVLKRHSGNKRAIDVVFQNSEGFFREVSVELTRRDKLPRVGATVTIELQTSTENVSDWAKKHPAWASRYVLAKRPSSRPQQRSGRQRQKNY